MSTLLLCLASAWAGAAVGLLASALCWAAREERSGSD